MQGRGSLIGGDRGSLVCERSDDLRDRGRCEVCPTDVAHELRMTLSEIRGGGAGSEQGSDPQVQRRKPRNREGSSRVEQADEADHESAEDGSEKSRMGVHQRDQPGAECSQNAPQNHVDAGKPEGGLHVRVHILCGSQAPDHELTQNRRSSQRDAYRGIGNQVGQGGDERADQPGHHSVQQHRDGMDAIRFLRSCRQNFLHDREESRNRARSSGKTVGLSGS